MFTVVNFASPDRSKDTRPESYAVNVARFVDPVSFNADRLWLPCTVTDVKLVSPDSSKEVRLEYVALNVARFTRPATVKLTNRGFSFNVTDVKLVSPDKSKDAMFVLLAVRVASLVRPDKLNVVSLLLPFAVTDVKLERPDKSKATRLVLIAVRDRSFVSPATFNVARLLQLFTSNVSKPASALRSTDVSAVFPEKSIVFSDNSPSRFSEVSFKLLLAVKISRFFAADISRVERPVLYTLAVTKLSNPVTLSDVRDGLLNALRVMRF